MNKIVIMYSITPPQSPRELVCPGAPMKKPRRPTSSPSVPECPGAPIKMPKCYGCYMMKKYGYGGENQASHMEEGGCLESKLE